MQEFISKSRLFADRAFYFIRRLFINKLTLNHGHSTAIYCGERKSQLEYSLIGDYSDPYCAKVTHHRDNIEEWHAFQAKKIIRLIETTLDTFTGICYSNGSSLIEETTSWPKDRLKLKVPTRVFFQ